MDRSRTARLAALRRLTTELIRIPSISPSRGESLVARHLASYLRSRGARVWGETSSRLPGGRRNLYAWIPGDSPSTIILTGHLDTVGIEDYERLAGGGAASRLAFDPRRLERILGPRFGRGRYLYGRGAFDMKGGLAIAAYVAARWAALPRRPGGLLVTAVCDEENESAGIRAATGQLRRIALRQGLHYLAALNTDYTSPRYPGDPHHYLYAGSIGKLLPAMYIAGIETHAGEPFRGLSPNLIAAEILRAAELDPARSEFTGEEATPPPVALHAGDLKEHYDVQTPEAAHLYCNHMTFHKTPAQVLGQWKQLARVALHRAETTRRNRLARFARRSPRSASKIRLPRGRVFTWDELLRRARRDHGAAADRWITRVARRHRAADPRRASLEVVRALVDLAGPALRPTVVVYYMPPYYPSVCTPEGTPLHRALEAVAATWTHRGIPVKLLRYYPYISDLSYLSADHELEGSLAALAKNLPLWNRGYRLDFADAAALDVPVANVGPSGAGAHKATERLDIAPSFGEVPEMIWFLLARLLAGSPAR